MRWRRLSAPSTWRRPTPSSLPASVSTCRVSSCWPFTRGSSSTQKCTSRTSRPSRDQSFYSAVSSRTRVPQVQPTPQKCRPASSSRSKRRTRRSGVSSRRRRQPPAKTATTSRTTRRPSRWASSWASSSSAGSRSSASTSWPLSARPASRPSSSKYSPGSATPTAPSTPSSIPSSIWTSGWPFRRSSPSKRGPSAAAGSPTTSSAPEAIPTAEGPLWATAGDISRPISSAWINCDSSSSNKSATATSSRSSITSVRNRRATTTSYIFRRPKATTARRIPTRTTPNPTSFWCRRLPGTSSVPTTPNILTTTFATSTAADRIPASIYSSPRKSSDLPKINYYLIVTFVNNQLAMFQWSISSAQSRLWRSMFFLVTMKTSFTNVYHKMCKSLNKNKTKNTSINQYIIITNIYIYIISSI